MRTVEKYHAVFQTHGISNRRYLDKVGGDDGELRLGARQPDGLDDEVTGGQLWVEDQVVRHRAGTAERQHVAVLGRAGETADHWV